MVQLGKKDVLKKTVVEESREVTKEKKVNTRKVEKKYPVKSSAAGEEDKKTARENKEERCAE